MSLTGLYCTRHSRLVYTTHRRPMYTTRDRPMYTTLAKGRVCGYTLFQNKAGGEALWSVYT